MKRESTEHYLDHSSLAVLYERAAPAILAYARSRLSSQEQAEDLLVEVFLAALEWEAFTLLTPDEQFAWLRRVAQYKIIDRYRQIGQLPTVTLEYVEKLLSLAGNQTPEQTVMQQEELQYLQGALKRLPPLQRQIILLHFVDELRCVEIASLLGKRDGTIRVLLSRALNRLRDIYSE